MAAGAEGDSNLPTSHAGREQVLDALKAAFVQGRLAKDEFDLRVSQVLGAYAELDAVTADIPAGLTTAQPPETIRKSHNKKLIQRGTAAGAGASVALTATIAVAARGNPVISLVIVGLVGIFVAVLLAVLLTLVSWILERASSRQPSLGSPPGQAAAHRYGPERPPRSPVRDRGRRDHREDGDSRRRRPDRYLPGSQRDDALVSQPGRGEPRWAWLGRRRAWRASTTTTSAECFYGTTRNEGNTIPTAFLMVTGIRFAVFARRLPPGRFSFPGRAL